MIRYYTQEEDDIIRENFNKISNKSIGLLIDRHQKSVQVRSQQLGLKSNVHKTCDYDFFATPNPTASYYAGLIASDGNIAKDKNYITLSQKEESVIQQFSKEIKSNYKISKKFSKKSPNPFYQTGISSKKMVDDLRNVYNITPAKSLSIKPPNGLDFINSLAYITGFIDGDGCIWTSRTHKVKLVFSVVSTYHLLDWMRGILDPSLIIRDKASISVFCCTNKKARNILFPLYKFPDVQRLRFNRKWSTIEEWINKYEDEFNSSDYTNDFLRNFSNQHPKTSIPAES